MLTHELYPLIYYSKLYMNNDTMLCIYITMFVVSMAGIAVILQSILETLCDIISIKVTISAHIKNETLSLGILAIHLLILN